MKSKVINLKIMHQIHLDFWTFFYNLVIWIIKWFFRVQRTMFHFWVEAHILSEIKFVLDLSLTKIAGRSSLSLACGSK